MRRPGRMDRLAYILGHEGESRQTQTLEELQDVAREFKAAGIDILGINGGDGTNHVTLTAVIKAYGEDPLPDIALLRGGTMNTAANGFGVMRASPDRILTSLVEKYHAGEAFQKAQHHILKVGDSYGFIFGTGVVYKFLQYYYAAGDLPSPTTAARVLGELIASTTIGGSLAKRLFARHRARVVADGEAWSQQEFITIAASTQPEIGLGFKPFYRFAEEPGLFHVVGFFAGALGMARETLRLYAGEPCRRDKVIDRVVRRLVIEADEPIGYTLDGDIHEAEEKLVLETGPLLTMILR